MTFTVVGLCAETGRVGVACTTSSIAVGARCPWTRPGVGAVTTQYLTDPALGDAVLDAMAEGLGAQEAVDAVLGRAENAPHAAYRQLAAIGVGGETGHHTGGEVEVHATSATGVNCVATGNLLSAPGVTSAMVTAFEQSAGHLAERLLRALEAGEAAGGERDQCHSAALLVTQNDPAQHWPLVNLRVDWSDATPLPELRSRWEMYEPQLEAYAMRARDPALSLTLQPAAEPATAAPLEFRGHSFLLYFDAKTEAALAAAGEQLDMVEGLGVVGQRFGYRPHISLSICGAVDLPSAGPALRRIAESTAPFELQLGALATGGGGQGLFAAEGLPSLMLLPTVTSQLLALHESVHDALTNVRPPRPQPPRDSDLLMSCVYAGAPDGFRRGVLAREVAAARHSPAVHPCASDRRG